MTGSRFKYRFSLVIGKIRLMQYAWKNQAVGIKPQLLACDGHVLGRKFRKFELPSSNTFRVIAKKKR